VEGDLSTDLMSERSSKRYRGRAPTIPADTGEYHGTKHIWIPGHHRDFSCSDFSLSLQKENML
jgi:hypothetical protein